MRILKRRRTWRTILAIPVGLTLGWLAAGYASDGTHADSGRPAKARPVHHGASEQLRDHRVGDEEAPAGEAEAVDGALQEAQGD